MLLLKHLDHLVDKLTMRSRSPDPQIHLSLLAHLYECFFHFLLLSKLVIFNGNDAKKHEDVVAADEECEHTVLCAYWH